MAVSPEERDAMAKLMSIVDGNFNSGSTSNKKDSSSLGPANSNSSSYVELAGPGQITQAEINAMSDVMSRLNSISNKVVDTMITEGVDYPQISEALVTEKTLTGVKVGRYQILIKEDQKRLAGKQFYSIYNSLTNDTIADDISLYETAITVVRLLNNGKFANCAEIRKLFEQDDAYTSHRIDALSYKRKLASITDPVKKDIFESRYQASLDRCMEAKKSIKTYANEQSRYNR